MKGIGIEPRSASQLDARVSQAVEHLEGHLSARQLEVVRSTLREAFATDPLLQELCLAATGAARAQSVGR
jgi:hypothetical protein